MLLLPLFLLVVVLVDLFGLLLLPLFLLVVVLVDLFGLLCFSLFVFAVVSVLGRTAGLRPTIIVLKVDPRHVENVLIRNVPAHHFDV